MSDSYLQYVPADPKFRPTAKAVVQAEHLLLRLLPDSEAVRASFYENVIPLAIGPASTVRSAVQTQSRGSVKQLPRLLTRTLNHS